MWIKIYVLEFKIFDVLEIRAHMFIVYPGVMSLCELGATPIYV